MSNILLLYPPGKLYQRGEDRAQTNITESSAGSIHACNDLGYAAAIIDSDGNNAVIRDYQTEGLTVDDVMADVIKFKPGIIFISVTNATIKDDISLAEKIRKANRCEVILKGAIFYNAKIEHLKTLGLQNRCWLVGGEIEFIIGPLVKSILGKNRDFENIPGIIYFDGQSYMSTGFGTWNTNLDDIPFPARNKMNNSLYVRPDTGEMMATINVSRGCPAKCIYCMTPIISGRKVRFRSKENIFGEIEECYYKYGIKNFFFRADTFTINNKWAQDICDSIINSPLYGKIQFTINARADTLSEELLYKLKKAGCFMLAIGFESGNDETLKRIEKGTTAAQNLKAAQMVKKAGLPLFGFFMIGFPWENKEHINDTFRHILKIDPDFAELHVAMPYFGTKLFDICHEMNTISDDAWGFDYISPNTKGSVYLSLEELKKLRKRFILKFYSRPGYLLKRFLDCVKKPVVAKNYFRYGLRLVENVLIKK